MENIFLNSNFKSLITLSNRIPILIIFLILFLSYMDVRYEKNADAEESWTDTE